MGKRLLKWALWLVLAAIVAIAVILVVTSGRLKHDNLAQRADLLASHVQYFAPPGGGRAPLVILSSGCGGIVGADGPNLIMSHYAQEAARAGAYAIIVDGIAARGMDRETAIRRVCAAVKLRGAERAGDILGGEELARRHWGSQFTGVILAGWSHGGWSVMELLSDRPGAKLVGNLRVDGRQAALKPDAVVLYYPFCGLLNNATRGAHWAFRGPLLLVTAERDTIGPARICLPIVERAMGGASGVRSVDMAGMTHAFDEQMQSPDSKFVYSPQAAARSDQLFGAFIAEQVARLHRG